MVHSFSTITSFSSICNKASYAHRSTNITPFTLCIGMCVGVCTSVIILLCVAVCVKISS